MDCKAEYDDLTHSLLAFMKQEKVKMSIEDLMSLTLVYVAKNKDYSFRIVGELKYATKKEKTNKVSGEIEYIDKAAFKSVQVFNCSTKKMRSMSNMEIRSLYAGAYRFCDQFTQIKLIEKIRSVESTLGTYPDIIDVQFSD